MREAWILLRGLTREVAHWGDFAPALAAALPGVEIVTVDLPGAGRSPTAWPATIRDAMELVRAQANARTRDSRRFVFGVSLGGMITMEWAAQHPEELAGVVVGASSARDVAPFWRRMRPRALARLALGAIRGDVALREAAVVRVVSNRQDLWPETTRRWVEIQRARPLAAATARGQIAAGARYRAPERLAVPSLFLVGLGDRLVHPDCSRALAARFGAPLSAHPSAGHDLTTDAGPWVIDELVRFRTSLGSALA